MLVITNQAIQAQGVQCVAWSEIKEGCKLDPRLHVVVDPAEGSDHLQANLARELSRSRTSGQFHLWVLNRHAAISLPDFDLEPLPSPVVGEASSPLASFRGVSLRPIYRIRQRRRLVPVCEVGAGEGGSAMVGALNLRQRVLAAPGGASLERYVSAVHEVARIRRASLLGLHAVTLVFLLILVALTASGRANRSRQVVELLRVAEQGVFWVPSPSTGETWLSAEAHMADRLLRNHLKSLAETADGLASPVHLDTLGAQREHMLRGRWVDPRLRPWPPAKIPFYLALLTGDVRSSFRVLRAAPSTRVDPTAWIQVLNATYWQTAVESLYELQFDKAVDYAELYIAASHFVVQQAQEEGTLPSFYTGMEDSEWESGLVGERNRTLAQVLLREARAGRLGPICANPGVSISFSHVLPRGGGEAITTRMVATLESRRMANRRDSCGARSRYDGPGPNFLLLPRLQELRSAASLSKEDFDVTLAEPAYAEACRAFALECGFSRVVADLKVGPSIALDSALTAAVRFAGVSCTYLSDDALYLALRRSKGALPGSTEYTGIRELRAARLRPEGDTIPSLPVEPSILRPSPMPSAVTPALLAAALGCLTPGNSDLYPTVAALLKDVPCRDLGTSPAPVDPASLLVRARATCVP